MNCTYCGAEVPGLAWRLCPACGAAYGTDPDTLAPVMLRLPAFHCEAGHRLGPFEPRTYAADALVAVRFGVPPTRYCVACGSVVIDGDWVAVEPPMDRPLTHGLCPDCAALAEEED